MKVTINYPVQIGDDEISVRLTADCGIINTGIGGYEYMGSVEFDNGQDVFEVDNIRWDQYLYTLYENNAIRIASETDKCYKAFEKEFKELIANDF